MSNKIKKKNNKKHFYFKMVNEIKIKLLQWYNADIKKYNQKYRTEIKSYYICQILAAHTVHGCK